MMLVGFRILNHEDPKDRKDKTGRLFSPHAAWNAAHHRAKTIATNPANIIFFAVLEVFAVPFLM
jgi:hypothetical protein